MWRTLLTAFFQYQLFLLYPNSMKMPTQISQLHFCSDMHTSQLVCLGRLTALLVPGVCPLSKGSLPSFDMVIGVAIPAQTNPHTERIWSGFRAVWAIEEWGAVTWGNGEKNFPRFQMIAPGSQLAASPRHHGMEEAKTQCSYFCQWEETQPEEKTNMQSGCSQGGWSQSSRARATAGFCW